MGQIFQNKSTMMTKYSHYMKFKFYRKYNVYGNIVRDLDFARILKSFIKLEKRSNPNYHFGFNIYQFDKMFRNFPEV